MEKRESVVRKMEYEEMERGGLSASFHRPPWHLTAAGMGKKEERDGTGKEKDGGANVKKLGTGGRHSERDIGG